MPRRRLKAVTDRNNPRLRLAYLAAGNPLLVGYGRSFILFRQSSLLMGGFTKRAKHGRAASGGDSTLARGRRRNRQKSQPGEDAGGQRKGLNSHLDPPESFSVVGL